MCQQKFGNTYEKKSLWKVLQIHFAEGTQDLIFSEEIISLMKVCLDFDKLKDGETVKCSFWLSF